MSRGNLIVTVSKPSRTITRDYMHILVKSDPYCYKFMSTCTVLVDIGVVYIHVYKIYIYTRV